MARFDGLPPMGKLMLIRSLLKERMKRGFFSRLFSNVDALTDEVILGTPEATIVSIEEAYHVLRSQGLVHGEAIIEIEEYRQSLAPGRSPRTPDLLTYIKYRVRLEHRKGRQIRNADMKRACDITTAAINELFGPNAQPKRETEKHVEDTNIWFMSELPHRDLNQPGGEFRTGELFLTYFENPRTIGEVTAGIDPPYAYPQVVVVSSIEKPLLIIRIERNSWGGSFLCSLDINGQHQNWGRFQPVARDDFIRAAGDIILRMKHGEGGTVEIKPLNR